MSDAQPVAFSEADEQIFQRVRSELLGQAGASTAPVAAPAPSKAPWWRFLVSFGLFVLLGIVLFTPVELAWLIGVLLLHETGHFLGMRYFGYQDVQMFFIPLFGAAVKGCAGGPGWICLTISGLFALLVLAPGRYKTATAAAELQQRWPDLPLQPAELSEAQWRDLFTLTRAQFKSNEKLLAQQMKTVHARALLRPESGRVATALFAVYLTAILLGIMTASVTRLGEDAGRWPIRIKPQVSEPDAPSTTR